MRWMSLLCLGAGLCLSPAASAQDGDEELPGVGAEAPNFALPTYNAEAAGAARAGTMLLVGDDVEDQDARLIVVSFMASHCKPCKKELPFLQKLHEQHRAKGLRVVGVSIDNEPEGIKQMGEILKEFKISFPVVKDQYNFTARRFLGNRVPLPSVFVLDRTGRIEFVSRGYNEEISKRLEGIVQAAVAAKPVEAKK